MSIVHKKVSAVPNIPGVWVQPTDWNDTHVQKLTSASYLANTAVPAGIDVVEGTGGSGGITLTLTGGFGPPIYAMKLDSGAGAVTFVDSGGAEFLGPGGQATSYLLVNQGQWVIFTWDGAMWLAFGV